MLSVQSLVEMSVTTYTVMVAEDKSGSRLDRLLADALPALSRTRLKVLIEGGRVNAAGRGPVVDPSRRVQGGEAYTVAVPEAAPAAPEPQPMPLDIVFEDGHLVVVEKPAGLVVHPGAGNPDGTLVNGLLARCAGGLSTIGGIKRPGIVHRLDKDTSGLIVVAKTDAAHLALVRQFAEHSVERAYFAVVWGVPHPRHGQVSGAIGRSTANRKKMAVVARGGKPALTRYRVLRTFGDVASLIECRPATGRTHQIRVHMTIAGHPLLGDSVYGQGRRRARVLPEPVCNGIAAFNRQALHAYLIGFTHPEDGRRLAFKSVLPHDINELICILDQV
jgi:23S rRNA pseudouridine1911/1915/1917 synthase